MDESLSSSRAPPASPVPSTQPAVWSGGADGTVTVVLRPGRLYWMALALPVVTACGLVLSLVAPYYADLATFVGLVTFFTVLLVLGIVTALYFKADRALVVDSRGVRLLRAGRVVNDVPWANVARFRFGVVPGGKPPATQMTLFWVHVNGRYRGLSVLENYYNIPYGALWTASLITAEMAQARGIPVVRKDGLIRDFGP